MALTIFQFSIATYLLIEDEIGYGVDVGTVAYSRDGYQGDWVLFAGL